MLGKYLFGSDGDGGPFSVGEKEEAELGAAPNPHLTALRCSQDLGAMGECLLCFPGNTVSGGVPATRRARCRRPGCGPGREPRFMQSTAKFSPAPAAPSGQPGQAALCQQRTS